MARNPKPPDPEIEAEFLDTLRRALALSPEEAKAVRERTTPAARARPKSPTTKKRRPK